MRHEVRMDWTGSFPNRLPCVKFTGPQPVTGNVALVQAQQLGFRDFDKAFFVLNRHLSLRAVMNVRNGLHFVHAGANHF